MATNPASASASAVLPIEIGSLTCSSPNESQFLGSSSGVFFVNTVLRAFADSHPIAPSTLNTTSDSESPAQVSVNNCIAEQGASVDLPTENIHTPGHDHSDNSSVNHQIYGRIQHGLGQPPDIGTAETLVSSYFKLWHPIFPFLHGPSFLEELEILYANDRNQVFQNASQNLKDTRQAILFQCIFNLSAMDCPEVVLLPEKRIESTTSLMSLLGVLSLSSDIHSLQALLAAQLYLMARMSLQAASIVGGMLVRKLFHAGLHRCPNRYSQLSQQDCSIRKRIFWCAYSTDRYLNHALGHPLAIQDSDIDVCMPGTPELHKHVHRGVDTTNSIRPGRETLLHLPEGHPNSLHHSAGMNQEGDRSIPATLRASGGQGDVLSIPPQHSEDVLTSYLGYVRILGRALELFHKSIHSRSTQNGDILTLKSEVHSWWNLLPYELQDLTGTGFLPHSQVLGNNTNHIFAPFFTIMYQQLIITIDRPFLSLDPVTPDFQSSLQTCLRASRIIVQTLRDYVQRRKSMSGPGVLSSIWMSGLVIAFACELRAYPRSRGVLEIETCLTSLNAMGKQWSNARHCHAVLSILSSNLKTQLNKGGDAGHQAPSRMPFAQNRSQRSVQRSRSLTPPPRSQDSEKRRRTYNTEAEVSVDSIRNSGNQQPRYQDQHLSYPEFDSTLYDNGVDMQDSGQVSELQWPDIFGQVSWEALFHGGSRYTGDTGFDF